jgi:hypothetical protein
MKGLKLEAHIRLFVRLEPSVVIVPWRV